MKNLACLGVFGEATSRTSTDSSEIPQCDSESNWRGRPFPANEVYVVMDRVLRTAVVACFGADDVRQAVQVHLLKHWPKLSTMDAPHFRRYVVRVCRGAAAQFYRIERRFVAMEALEEQSIPLAVSAENLFRAREELAWLARALAKLPKQERTVLDLVALEERRVTDVAKSLQIPRPTIAATLNRARARLVAQHATEMSVGVDLRHQSGSHLRSSVVSGRRKV